MTANADQACKAITFEPAGAEFDLAKVVSAVPEPEPSVYALMLRRSQCHHVSRRSLGCISSHTPVSVGSIRTDELSTGSPRKGRVLTVTLGSHRGHLCRGYTCQHDDPARHALIFHCSFACLRSGCASEGKIR